MPGHGILLVDPPSAANASVTSTSGASFVFPSTLGNQVTISPPNEAARSYTIAPPTRRIVRMDVPMRGVWIEPPPPEPEPVLFDR